MVEKSAGGSVLSESRRMVGDLEYVWKMFVQGSQEQLTRLRVAGVFFRTMEQVRVDDFFDDLLRTYPDINIMISSTSCHMISSTLSLSMLRFTALREARRPVCWRYGAFEWTSGLRRGHA